MPAALFDTLIEKLAPEGAAGLLPVVIETPKGSRNKYKWEEELGAFVLGSVLPSGADFPYDFGFVPDTLAEDGDPLDVLLLMDEPAFTGCLLAARVIGVMEVSQTEKRKTVRNDRVIAVASEAHTYRSLRTVKDLDQELRKEIEHFFVSYGSAKGKKIVPLGWFGPARAQKLVTRARKAHGARQVSSRRRA